MSNLKCSNWAIIKSTLHCPPSPGLLQFHPFSCSGQIPGVILDSFLFPISNLLANAISSTFKILSESKAFFPTFTASPLPQATTIVCLNYSFYPHPPPAQPILHPAVRRIRSQDPSAHHLHGFPILLNQALPIWPHFLSDTVLHSFPSWPFVEHTRRVSTSKPVTMPSAWNTPTTWACFLIFFRSPLRCPLSNEAVPIWSRRHHPLNTLVLLPCLTYLFYLTVCFCPLEHNLF